MQDRIDILLQAAEAYRALGMKPLPLDGKTPGPLYMVMGWQKTQYDEDAIRRCLLAAEKPDIGVQMGPRPFGSGVIDFEHDTPAQKAKMLEMFEGDLGNGPAFASRNGEHYLFAWDDRLEAIGKAVVKVDCGPGDDGLKVRIGAAGKGAQSAVPPSTNKHWLPGRELGECELQPLPEIVIVQLLGLGVIRAAKTANKSKKRKRPISRDSRAMANALEAMLHHKPKEDENDGSGRLVLLCRIAVEHDLSDEVAIEVIRRYERKWPFRNRQYVDSDIVERIRSAEERTERGSAPLPLRKFDDIGNGQRFADRHSKDVRYSEDWHKWLVWSGSRWKLDNLGEIMTRAKETVRSIALEAEKSDHVEAIRKWAKESASHGKLVAMLKCAVSEREIAIDYHDFNAHPWLFNCDNGTVDLRGGTIRPHRRSDLLTVIAPVEYAQTYEPPKLWLEFLYTIFDGDLELIAFIQRLFGLSLVGEVRDHILPIFLGGGANGKTVLTLTWMGMLGDDYALCTSKEFLMKTATERHSTELAALYGKRLVVSAETDEGAKLNEARVKHLTGGNIINARRMREDPWSFEPSHTLILETNHRPLITGTDNGIWRRVLLVPFNVTIPPERQDKDLANKLKAEWPQIFRWAVEGCVEWQRDGLNPPECVTIASREYEEASDLLADFVRECVIVKPTAMVKAIVFYRRYEQWVRARGHQPQSLTRLGERIASMYPKKKTMHGTFYQGIELTAEDFYGDAEGFSVVEDGE
jgi:putative DNA primase/helicase